MHAGRIAASRIFNPNASHAMVTRLRFKGDPPHKRRRGPSKNRPPKSLPDPAAAPAPLPDESLLTDGWTTATCVEDLDGPVMITRELLVDPVPVALCVTPEGSVDWSTELDILDPHECINFPLTNEQPAAYAGKLHRTEPTLTTQILIASPAGARHALKTPAGNYLSLSGNTLDTGSKAVGTAQTFTFTPRPTATNGVWFELSVDSRKVCVLDGDLPSVLLTRCIPDPEDLIDDECRYVVRVQTANSRRGKELLRQLQSTTTDPVSTQVDEAAHLLEQLGIAVTEAARARLHAAATRGNLALEKMKLSSEARSDRRC